VPATGGAEPVESPAGGEGATAIPEQLF